MKILAMETSSKLCGVCLCEDEKLIDIADYMNTFDYVTFKKTITETTLAEDGTVKNMEYIQMLN